VSATANQPLTFADAEEALAASLPGYQARRTQQQLAAQIESAIADGSILLAEAGTGTGKSLAALIPAILSGKRTVVATATKALQTQYATKDLPFLAEHLGIDFRWAVIKGRSNYPCAQKIADLNHPTATQERVLGRVAEIEAGADPNAFADRDELPRVTDSEWSQMSMSAGECPGAKDCPFAVKGLCFAQRAKAKAAAADIVITNLAYLAIDMMLRSQGPVDLLGQFRQLVIDEGHNLDSSVTSALSDRIALGTFQRLAGDAMSWLVENGGDMQAAQGAGFAGQQLWDDLDAAFRAWKRIREQRREDAAQMPVTFKVRAELLDRFAGVGESLGRLYRELQATEPASDNAERRQMRLVRRVSTLAARIHAIATDEDDVTVRWAEAEDGRLFLCSAPVSPAPFLRENLWGQVPTVLMSATLATGRQRDGRGDFSYMTSLLGLDAAPAEVRTFETGTPFDYRRQAVLYVPDRDKPIPSGQTATAWKGFAQTAMRHLIDASGGGSLLLFTSRSAMEDAWSRLRGDLEMQGLEVLKQGDAPTHELVTRFKDDGNAVLFALRTFFEGIDIPGDALRLVVIDKLPFPVPSDLQFAARCEAVNKRAGRDVSFQKLSLPMMTLPLVQAFGRLLRTTTDRGLVAILDPRLTGKGYGTTILNSLPPAKTTTDLREAIAFLTTNH
jgi:ATP-dependent DNA helicase DinG